MIDREQPDVTQMGLTQLARWSSIIGILAVLGHIGAFFLAEQWQLLALAGVGAGIVVLWSFAPRIGESDFELGVWSYIIGVFAAALALGLLARGPAIAVLLALGVLTAALLLGRQSLIATTLIALVLLGAAAGADILIPWERTDYGGYLPITQFITDAALLISLGVLIAQASLRLHMTLAHSSQLQEETDQLGKDIERLSVERGKELRIATDIARLALAADDDVQLLEPAANTLRERYGLANVLVYLLGADGDYADLRLMVGRALAVRTGSMDAILVDAETLAGQAMERLEAVAQAKPTDAAVEGEYSELATPMVVGGELLGVLLLQCGRRDSFSEAEIEALSAITDQLALALKHVRTHAEPMTRAAAAARRPRLTTTTKSVRVGEEALAEAIASLEPSTDKPVEKDDMLVAPIAVQGEVIGALGFREGESRQLSTDELALVQAVADQVAQAVETLNLLEGTERVALREQLVNDITAQLQRSSSVDEVLQITAQALQKALEGYEVSIRLSPEALGIGRPLAALSSMGDNEDEEV